MIVEKDFPYVAGSARVGVRSIRARGSWVGEFAELGESVHLGHYSRVKSHALVGERAHIGSNVVIGASVAIGARAILLDGVQVSPENIVSKLKQTYCVPYDVSIGQGVILSGEVLAPGAIIPVQRTMRQYRHPETGAALTMYGGFNGPRFSFGELVGIDFVELNDEYAGDTMGAPYELPLPYKLIREEACAVQSIFIDAYSTVRNLAYMRDRLFGLV